MKKIYKITIVWGTDGFWKWLAEFILQEFQGQVAMMITWRNREKWEKLVASLSSKGEGIQGWGVYFTDDNIKAVQDADIVIYSVPISYTQKVIEETLPYCKPWAVVADVTSIKKFPSRALSARDDLIVIPTHPMFWPYISSIAGQVIVLTPEERVKSSSEYLFLKSYLQNNKAKFIEETPEYHDKMMAVVQWLTHFNMFVVGETMKRLGFKISSSMDFISPIYKLMMSSVGRYLGQNPGLYADIQMYNEEVLEVHEKFLDTANNFHKSVQEKDAWKFCSDIISAREFFETEHCREGQEYTDKVIYLIWKQIEILRSKLWKRVVLCDIYTREEVSGELLDFNEKEISLQWKKEKYLLNTWEVLP